MAEQETTPTPWETSDGAHEKGRTGWPAPSQWSYVRHNFEYPPYEGELDEEWGIYPPLGESGPVALVAGEANAALIVRAVNAHAGLVEALEEMIAAMVAYELDVDDEPTGEHRALMVRARAALATARGE